MTATFPELARTGEPASPPETPRLLNREIQWLAFNERVLEEAEDFDNPLLERIKFLAIFTSNLDEFFMVRVSGLKNQLESFQSVRSDDGLTPAAQLAAILQALQPLLQRAAELWQSGLLIALEERGVFLRSYDKLDEETRARLAARFEKEIFPVLTPLAIDPGHPFPYISNLSLNLAVRLRDPQDPDASPRFARVKIPDLIPRLLPVSETLDIFVDVAELIRANLPRLFPGMEILDSGLFRVTRDADLEIDEDEADDLLKTVEQELKRRRFGAAVRLEVAAATAPEMVEFLRDNLELAAPDIYALPGFMPWTDLMELTRLDRPELKDPPFFPAIAPALAEDADIFAAIRNGDILLHHPFDAFDPVTRLIQTAVADKDVLAIKMTLYRTGPRSPILPALMAAVESGKQVAVVIELRARFDEATNIEWAKKLERAGVHVVYGVVGLKTHAKIALVVRRESGQIRRYVHLATGNYNAATARVYSDFGLMTCRESFGEDATALFNTLTGVGRNPEYQRLVTAPDRMRDRMIACIEGEIAAAREGRPARIFAKMNALVDPPVIEALYAASAAGVRVELLVRGICCLQPGVPGLSENIEVRSIVGRFLEHSRVFDFLNDGCYLSSADWMPRNFNGRVELAFPVDDEGLRRRVVDSILAVYWRDNLKSRRLIAGGKYERLHPAPDQPPFCAQEMLLKGEMK
jgi:polyphosphate kinase